MYGSPKSQKVYRLPWGMSDKTMSDVIGLTSSYWRSFLQDLESWLLQSQPSDLRRAVQELVKRHLGEGCKWWGTKGPFSGAALPSILNLNNNLCHTVAFHFQVSCWFSLEHESWSFFAVTWAFKLLKMHRRPWLLYRLLLGWLLLNAAVIARQSATGQLHGQKTDWMPQRLVGMTSWTRLLPSLVQIYTGLEVPLRRQLPPIIAAFERALQHLLSDAVFLLVNKVGYLAGEDSHNVAAHDLEYFILSRKYTADIRKSWQISLQHLLQF